MKSACKNNNTDVRFIVSEFLKIKLKSYRVEEVGNYLSMLLHLLPHCVIICNLDSTTEIKFLHLNKNKTI